MNDKEIARVAAAIELAIWRIQMLRYTHCLQQLSVFVSRLNGVANSSKRLGIALSHHWLAAAEHCCTGIAKRLNEFPALMSAIRSLLERRRKRPPSFSAIIEELKAAETEFGDLTFDREEQALCVVTEPIVLEDVYLGPFHILLILERLGRPHYGNPCRLVAVDPNPAAGDETVTHPHVSNETLCEGDGTVAIRAALEEGRICDFFCIVRSILTTYNDQSAHVSLSDWDGVPCHECGYVMDGESSYYCDSCGDAVCDQCSVVCTNCGEIVCSGCSSMCEVCGASLCTTCAKGKCIACESICCESCLDNGLCPTCREERECEDEEENQSHEKNETTEKHESETAATGPELAARQTHPPGTCSAVQSHGMGEAPALPGQG